MEELLDFDFMSLQLCPLGQLLRNSQSGEQILLTEGGWSLVENGGCAMLCRRGLDDVVSADWVANRRDLHEAAVNCPKGDGAIAIDTPALYNTVTATIVWQSDRLAVRADKVVPMGHFDNAPLRFEIFISPVPRGGYCVRWGLPHVVDHLYGTTHTGHWLTKAVQRFLARFGLLDMDATHVTHSVLSGRCRAK